MDPQKPTHDQPIATPTHSPSGSTHPVDREAAAQIMRDQIDRLYENHDISTQPSASTQTTQTYHRTHSETEDHRLSEQHSHDWQQYHSQWQQYYQQYYERYYMNQLASRQNKLGGSRSEEATAAPRMITAGEPEQPKHAQTFSNPQAVNDLRSQLLDQVKAQTSRVRSSKHFVPIMAALIVGLTFIFLQYNSLIFAQVRAYVSPGSISPANLIVDPTTDTKVGPEPKIIIPKINVDAPVVFDVPSIQESIVQEKLKSGVVHYPIPGASALPGQKGNSVILGHSSNDVFDDGNYKFVFVQLNNLEKGDTFYVHYNSVRYTYSVTDKKVIDPTQVSELVINNGQPLMTLVTCTPPGTALKRLIVIAQQISPDPDKASAGEQSTGDGSKVTIPGNTPSLFQRLFGG